MRTGLVGLPLNLYLKLIKVREIWSKNEHLECKAAYISYTKKTFVIITI